MTVSPADHVNEVAHRLGPKGCASKAHHCTIMPYASDVKFQIVYTRQGKQCQLETVWTFDAPKDFLGKNKRRGEACQKMLADAGAPEPIFHKFLANDARVGFSFAIPAAPDAAFYDRVAELARWAQSHIRPSDLDRVK